MVSDRVMPSKISGKNANPIAIIMPPSPIKTTNVKMTIPLKTRIKILATGTMSNLSFAATLITRAQLVRTSLEKMLNSALETSRQMRLAAPAKDLIFLRKISAVAFTLRTNKLLIVSSSKAPRLLATMTTPDHSRTLLNRKKALQVSHLGMISTARK